MATAIDLNFSDMIESVTSGISGVEYLIGISHWTNLSLDDRTESAENFFWDKVKNDSLSVR